MPEPDANLLLAAILVLLTIVGGTIAAWKRATADLKETAELRGAVKADLQHLKKLPEKVDRLERCQTAIKEDVAWIRGRLEKG